MAEDALKKSERNGCGDQSRNERFRRNQNRLTAEDIARAEGVIVAADKSRDESL